MESPIKENQNLDISSMVKATLISMAVAMVVIGVIVYDVAKTDKITSKTLIKPHVTVVIKDGVADTTYTYIKP